MLVAQVFTKNAENNPAIEGISIESVPLLQSLFADDTDLFISADQECVRAVFRELEAFGRCSGCKFNIHKTHCIPLGNSKNNSDLILNLRQSYGQGFVPDDSKFKALGIVYSGSDLKDTINANYNAKISKIKNIIKIWERRNLTIYGRLTLIKCFLISQLVYLIKPLPSPEKAQFSTINGLLYKFLWGGKREKLKRDFIDQPKQLGGLDMINFENFFIGLKVKLLNKLLDYNFNHPWKEIVTNQLKFPNNPVVSLEVGAVKSNRKFTKNLVECYSTWKQKAANSKNKTSNFCVWGGGIPGGQSLLWSDTLIQKNIIYASDFVNELGQMYSYQQFRYKHNIRIQTFTKTEFASVKLALRRFNVPDNMQKSLHGIDASISLQIFLGSDLKSVIDPSCKEIRGAMIQSSRQICLSCPQFEKWSNELEGLSNEKWTEIFVKLYKQSNHMKLIQHQYKIYTQIATSKYLRFKMKISSSPTCSNCHGGKVETLEHIYLNCEENNKFFNKVSEFIKDDIEPNYRSDLKLNRFSCSHENSSVNYVNLVANWYVGRKTQYQKKLYWDEFLKYVRCLLVGEKTVVVSRMRQIFED